QHSARTGHVRQHRSASKSWSSRRDGCLRSLPSVALKVWLESGVMVDRRWWMAHIGMSGGGGEGDGAFRIFDDSCVPAGCFLGVVARRTDAAAVGVAGGSSGAVRDGVVDVPDRRA